MSKKKNKDPLRPKEDVKIKPEDKDQGFLETLKKTIKSPKKKD
ncbi:hypothetical protein [uncultured Algibacter sp.]|nr:hypothetical protein [uncultured Algibacter sp.]